MLECLRFLHPSVLQKSIQEKSSQGRPTLEATTNLPTSQPSPNRATETSNQERPKTWGQTEAARLTKPSKKISQFLKSKYTSQKPAHTPGSHRSKMLSIRIRSGSEKRAAWTSKNKTIIPRTLHNPGKWLLKEGPMKKKSLYMGGHYPRPGKIMVLPSKGNMPM